MGVTTTTRDQNATRSRKSTTPAASLQETAEETQYTDGESDEFEFGGSFGAASLMIGFPLLMWYMWIGATYYDGRFPTPAIDQSWGDFVRHLANLVYEGAYPTAKAWAMYWTFFIFEALM